MKMLREQHASCNLELKEYIEDSLNDKINRKIEIYDKQICYKNSQILSKVKKSSIIEYKSYMDKQV
jgi:hypothetical protein